MFCGNAAGFEEERGEVLGEAASEDLRLGLKEVIENGCQEALPDNEADWRA